MVALSAWLLLAAVGSFYQLKCFQANNRDLPFGVFRFQGNALCLQDFSFNYLFLRGIDQHTTAHPFRLEDQEKIVRTMIPGATSGMTHAYSPVALVLARPLFALPGAATFGIYLALSCAAVFLLFRYDLVPRMKTPGQLAAAAICVASFCLLASCELGQTTLLTTPLIGAVWFMLRRSSPRGWSADLLLAVLLVVIAFKPSVALVPAMLLLAAGAWRALGFAALMLVGIWLCTSSYYGGLVSGLADYSQLLNHYNNADFTPFLRRDYVPGHDSSIRFWFAFDRFAVLLVSLGLLAARRLGYLAASEHFQATVWAFLLLSPYQLPSEDFILCLLVVEGRAFVSGPAPVIVARLLLLTGIFDCRAGITFPLQYQVEYPLKCILAFVLLAPWLLERLVPHVRLPIPWLTSVPGLRPELVNRSDRDMPRR